MTARSIGDLFDVLEARVEKALSSGKYDKAILLNKENVAADLYKSNSIQTIDPIGEVESQVIEIREISSQWEGEKPVPTTRLKLQLRQRIKPNKDAHALMSLPVGSYRKSPGEVKHDNDWLILTIDAGDGSLESTAKRKAYGEKEIANQMTTKNAAVKGGNNRVLGKINKTISGRLPHLQKTNDKKSQLEENLRKLK